VLTSSEVRIDLRPNITASGKGVAYITDSSSEGRNGLVIVDIGAQQAWRHLDGMSISFNLKLATVNMSRFHCCSGTTAILPSSLGRAGYAEMNIVSHVSTNSISVLHRVARTAILI